MLDGLRFANGVALAADESYVAVAETGGRTVVRHWLTGPRQGQTDHLATDLPGYPDNISRGSDGLVWVTVASPTDPVVERLMTAPMPVRRLAWRVPARIQPRPKRTVRVLALDDTGAVVHDLSADAVGLPPGDRGAGARRPGLARQPGGARGRRPRRAAMSDLDDVREGLVPGRMLPALAYTSEEVLAWELRHLYAGTWTCLGRREELAARRRDPACRAGRGRRRAAGRRRAGADVREHLPAPRPRAAGGRGDHVAAERRLPLPRVDLRPGRRRPERARVPGRSRASSPATTGWSSCRSGCGPAGCSGTPRRRGPRCRSSEHLGDLAGIVAAYAPERLRLADRHTYEVAANWKVIAENYHECYHCPLIHPELCRVTPPTSGDNYDLPGAWVGGSMELRDGMATMSLTGRSGGLPLPGVDPTPGGVRPPAPEPARLGAPRLRDDPPAGAARAGPHVGRVLVVPGARGDGTVPDATYAVEFWDLTNRQDWAACESVQRGLGSPHFRPGPFAPDEDAVARFVRLVTASYTDA